MFRFNKGFNITIIVLSFVIVLATVVLIAVFPSKFELIFGTGTFLFVSLGMFVSLQSLDTATGARVDSEKSADATVASAESARKALQLALEEAIRAKERYRVENSSLLKLHKGQIHLPLIEPYNRYYASDTEDIYSRQNYDFIFLRNSGVGTASTIDLDVNFINAHEFDGFEFNSEEPIAIRLREGHVQVKNIKFPLYEITTSYVVTEGAPDKIKVNGIYFREELGRKTKRTLRRTFSVNWIKPKRIGSQEKSDEFPVRLPQSFCVLAQQFFLERKLVDNEEMWRTPNPRLRIRVTYTEEILEHMNDHEEARRVKEFEISCNDDVRFVSIEETERFGYIGISCDLNIQTIFDRPLAHLMAEELLEEEMTDGSTGPTGTWRSS